MGRVITYYDPTLLETLVRINILYKKNVLRTILYLF